HHIWGQMRNTDLPTNRYDVYDTPTTAIPDIGNCGEHRIEGSPRMCFHRRLIVLQTHGVARSDLNHPGIGDKNIEASEGFGSFPNGTLHILVVSNVAGDDQSPVPDLVQFTPCYFKRGRISGN